MDGDLPINDRIEIPASELTWSFSRSGGPGGQHVNTTDTRVRLRFALSTTDALSGPVKARLADQCRQWLTTDGDLVLTCDVHRSQHRNVEAARERLAAAIREALVPPRPRRATRPTRSSQRRRVQAKKQRGEVKRARGRVRGDD